MARAGQQSPNAPFVLVFGLAFLQRHVWVIIITILFVLPPNELALWTMVALSIFLAVYWFAFERSRFKGPRHMTEAELTEVEREYAF